MSAPHERPDDEPLTLDDLLGGDGPKTAPDGSFDEDLTPAPSTAAVPQTSFRGEVFGPYELVERVGLGGMAEVFKAKRSGIEGFEKVVALKRILPHLSANPDFVRMFVDEAKMVAGLSHPNIVPIFELGRIGSSYYIAMEYVHGRDLRSVMRRAAERRLRLPLDLSLRVVGQVCAALEYAQRKRDEQGRAMQIVHRDINPQNVLVSFDGEVKLVDFGIARAETMATATDPSVLRGKLFYMSPEQASGRALDGRSDLYSLGLVLYELVTGTRPFQPGLGRTTVELVREGLVTPPRRINPRLPEPLERVMLRVLAREPDERYQDAGQMQRALELVMPERPATARDLARFLELLFDRGERGEDGSARPGGAP